MTRELLSFFIDETELLISPLADEVVQDLLNSMRLLYSKNIEKC